MVRRRSRARGYTLIEAMVAAALLVMASAGVVALQKVSTVGNMQAKELAVATHIGQTWMERLRADAMRWNYPSPSYPGVASNLGNTAWVGAVSVQANKWFRPNDIPNRGGAGFDALGNDTTDPARVTFCTHLRLNWMYPPSPAGSNLPDSELIRADVRVFWLRQRGFGPLNNVPLCDASNAADTMFKAAPPTAADAALPRYHAIYFSSSLQKNVATSSSQ